MNHSARAEFGKWRSRFWPIYSHELKELLPMFLMIFLIAFNYNLLRDIKDTLIITAPGSGAEAIPFVKVWCVLPCAFLFMITYAKLSNLLSKDKLFYATLSPFLIFFAVFAWVIYPNRDLLHPVESANWLQENLPKGFSGLIALYRNWTYAIFYVISELWGSVCISLLFWGFANDVIKIDEAKRFYSVFGLGASISLPFSGSLTIWASNIRNQLPENIDSWGVSLKSLTSIILCAGLITMGLYYYIYNYALKNRTVQSQSSIQAKLEKKKNKLSIWESYRILLQSRYLLCIAILVIAYGLTINLYEVTWKSQIKIQYSHPNDFSTFMGHFTMALGFVTILMTLFFGGNMIRQLGWKYSAMFTPVVVILSGSLFMFFVIFNPYLKDAIAHFGTTPIFLAVIIGAIQNILSKASKYSLFDPTKEIAYIPLDEDSKVKGKAAIDVVGARLGKSGGSLIQQILVIILGSLSAITPFLFLFTIGIGFGWIWAILNLDQEFSKITEKK